MKKIADPLLCKCGCGEQTSGKIDHGKISLFIRGHNVRGSKRPFKERPKAKGRLVWNKGIRTGIRPANYKGDCAGYSALHNWVYRWKGKPEICDFCKGNKNMMWANKSHEYKRDIGDWISLCQKCHRNYDKSHWGIASKLFKLK